MQNKKKHLTRLSFLFISAIFLLTIILCRPVPERLHGTFSNEDVGVLVLFEEKAFSNEGKFMIYPFNHPYEEAFFDEGTFCLNEKGVIIFQNVEGKIFYAELKSDVLLLSDAQGACVLWQ